MTSRSGESDVKVCARDSGRDHVKFNPGAESVRANVAQRTCIAVVARRAVGSVRIGADSRARIA
jgi:hypothetical protein